MYYCSNDLMFALYHCLVTSKVQFYGTFLYDELVGIRRIVEPKYLHDLHRTLLIIQHSRYHILIVECPTGLSNTAERDL